MEFHTESTTDFSVTLLYEVVQYIFAIGASDITDLLGNTLGGVIGIALFVCQDTG